MRTVLLTSLLLAASSSSCAAPGGGQGPERPARRPNILLVVSDDHAAHALSCYGGKLDRTPGLDRLAAEGMRFDRAFVTNALCGPSRATVLTGRYSHVNGFAQNDQRFDAGQWTVARALQQAGYATAAVGKWHLEANPVDAGFDRGIVLPGQGRYTDPFFLVDGKRTKVDGYASERITDFAIQWLQERPADKPFFLFLGHKAPHREWSPPPHLLAEYRSRTFAEPATLFDDHATRSDAARIATMTVARDLTRTDVKMDVPPGLEGADRVRWHYQRYIQDYLATVRGMDEQVARLLSWMDEHGLAEDTIVVYTSDNGFFLGDHGFYDKRFMYEESMRVPLLVRWPGVVQPGTAQQAMTLNTDFAATLLEAAGAPVPEGLQGRSLVPLLQGRQPADWRDDAYYHYYEHLATHNVHEHYGVRTATHKLIRFPHLDAWELYDLVADPEELVNVAPDPSYAAVRRDLEQRLARLRAELRVPAEGAAQVRGPAPPTVTAPGPARSRRPS